MEIKELKIRIPDGYELDAENTTLDCIKFKPIKKCITYEEICDNLFSGGAYYINVIGKIEQTEVCYKDTNNATNAKQLVKLLALNQLLNIAEYYNRLHPKRITHIAIEYDGMHNTYCTTEVSTKYLRGIKAIFNDREDAQSIIDNPNFREILDTIYKN